MPVSTRTLRLIVGRIILWAHLAAIAVFVLLGPAHLSLIQVLTGIATILPLGAFYLAAYGNYVTNYPDGALDDRQTVRTGACLLHVLLALSLGGVLVLAPAIILTTSPTGNVEHALTAAGLVEAMLAAYIAIAYRTLFPSTRMVLMELNGQTGVN